MARLLAGLVVAAAAGWVGWGLSLALRGAWAQLVPAEPAPRRLEHAVLIRERGSGRYLVYTEIQVRPGDLLITPDGRLWRIEQVGFDTAWARPAQKPPSGSPGSGGPDAPSASQRRPPSRRR